VVFHDDPDVVAYRQAEQAQTAEDDRGILAVRIAEVLQSLEGLARDVKAFLS
jgi:hypothetical protein